MTRRAIHPGRKIREVITSKFVNELTRDISPSTFVNSIGFDNPDVRVYGQMFSSGDPIELYEPVLIRKPVQVYNTNNPSLPQETQNVPTVYVDKLSQYNVDTHGWLPHWGIAQGLITDKQAAQVLLTGVSFLKHTGSLPGTNLPLYRGIDLVNGSMVYDLFGRAEIIGPLVSGESHCMVHLTRRLRSAICGKSIATIPAGGSGMFYLQSPGTGGWSNSTVQLLGYNRNNSVAISANKNLVAVEVDGRWVIIFAEC